METKIYSIVYDKNQIVEYEKYDNSHIKTIEQKSYLFEYNVLIDVIDNHNIAEDYLGILLGVDCSSDFIRFFGLNIFVNSVFVNFPSPSRSHLRSQ